MKLIFVSFISLFLATAVIGADTNNLPNLAARLNKAGAEKKIDARLNGLADVAKTLSSSEIPEALKAADNQKQLREQIVLKESAFKRQGAGGSFRNQNNQHSTFNVEGRGGGAEQRGNEDGRWRIEDGMQNGADQTFNAQHTTPKERGRGTGNRGEGTKTFNIQRSTFNVEGQ
jgi:hypothetical protein